MEFVSFDLETTGTLSHLDQIVELGAVRFKNGKPQECYQQLVSINGPMPEQASAVNGITDDMLKGKPHLQDVLPNFAAFCGDSLMVAHNAPFDFQFLLRAIEEHQLPAPRGPVFDTCQLARRSFPGLANYKLASLCHYLKIESEGFHRAQADATCCGHLFVHILKKNGCSVYDTKTLVKIADRQALKFPVFLQQDQMSLF